MLTRLAADPIEGVLLVTNLLTGNVLRAQGQPCLMIEPKRFIGDPGYELDAASVQLRGAAAAGSEGADLQRSDFAQVEASRVRLWLSRRAAVPREKWPGWKFALARRDRRSTSDSDLGKRPHRIIDAPRETELGSRSDDSGGLSILVERPKIVARHRRNKSSFNVVVVTSSGGSDSNVYHR